MKYRLLSGSPRRRDEVHTLGLQSFIDGSTYPDNCGHKLTIERRFDLPKVDNVASRNDKSVAGSCGIEGEECNPVPILAHNFY
jgi:hypothetical protein